MHTMKSITTVFAALCILLANLPADACTRILYGTGAGDYLVGRTVADPKIGRYYFESVFSPTVLWVGETE